MLEVVYLSLTENIKHTGQVLKLIELRFEVRVKISGQQRGTIFFFWLNSYEDFLL